MLIGDNVKVRSIVATIELVSDPGGTLEIGDYTFINYGTSIAATESVRIGRDCHVGPYSMVMDNAYHSIEPERRNEIPSSLPVVVGDNVWIGARVILLPGSTIGDGSVIAAGSIVSGDVPARSLAAGVPCRVIRGI